ncbi:hypothetical protein BXZ70DRAFT_756981 [Cristinia sonorae]|uniref:Uncharacterized protein n=1 Tax=Cristinia sonorae TaxID=1940300 RepID=A0A8K0US71_9AGAR|nr:hypothetical protein BXZ70DRAFT_756981 [Cristinia sonorae]
MSATNMTAMSSIPPRRSPSPPAFSAKFEHLVSPLPRRPPPTALRLVQGPLPSRARPKHTLPSLPRPAFHPKIHVAHSGPAPRKLAKEALTLEKEVPQIHLAIAKVHFPDLKVPGYSSDSDGDSDEESTSGSDFGSRRGSFESVQDNLERGRKMIRGPWDHAGSIKVPFDVNAVLPPPRRAAINVVQRA